MPSISDTLHIASQAIENALTVSSTKRVPSTTALSGIHNHKKKLSAQTDDQSANNTIDETKDEATKHIDLRI